MLNLNSCHNNIAIQSVWEWASDNYIKCLHCKQYQNDHFAKEFIKQIFYSIIASNVLKSSVWIKIPGRLFTQFLYDQQ